MSMSVVFFSIMLFNVIDMVVAQAETCIYAHVLQNPNPHNHEYGLN